jgi:hypothetical protein
VNVRPRQGETAAQAVDRTRDEIVAVQNNLDIVQRAPLPRDDLKKTAGVLVALLAQRCKPKVSAGRDGVEVAFSDPRADTLCHHLDIAAFYAWLDPTAMVRAIEREIDKLPDTLAPMSAKERERRAGELAGQLLELERMEEMLIEMAASEGIDIGRRENASAAAVLGIVVIAKVKALVAA